MALPSSKVALITNCRLIMVAEGSGSKSGEPGTSGSSPTEAKRSDVRLEWECEWEDLLATQLRCSKSASPADPPDRVVLFRKEGSPEGVMEHEWRCRPRSAQAEQLLAIVQAARLKYCASFRASVSTDPPTPVISGDGSFAMSSPQEGPSSIVRLAHPSWRLIWRSSSGGTASIWRPLASNSFTAVGDVLMQGRSPPSSPIAMLQDAAAAGAGRKIVLPSGREISLESRLTCRPSSWWLVWRSAGKGHTPAHIANGEGAVSIWLPVSPSDKYRPLGCVAVPALEEPPLSLGVCVRRDLLQQAELEQMPTWKGIADDRSSWSCYMWRVKESSSRNFFAARRGGSQMFSLYRFADDIVDKKAK